MADNNVADRVKKIIVEQLGVHDRQRPLPDHLQVPGLALGGGSRLRLDAEDRRARAAGAGVDQR